MLPGIPLFVRELGRGGGAVRGSCSASLKNRAVDVKFRCALHRSNRLWNGRMDQKKEPEPGEEGEGQDRRPTPVRVVMDGAPEKEGISGNESRILVDPATGQEWIARITGRSSSGVVPTRSIALMEVAFFSPGDPDTPVRHTLCQSEAMGELGEDGILQVFRASLPYRPPPSPPSSKETKGRRNRSRREA